MMSAFVWKRFKFQDMAVVVVVTVALSAVAAVIAAAGCRFKNRLRMRIMDPGYCAILTKERTFAFECDLHGHAHVVKLVICH